MAYTGDDDENDPKKTVYAGDPHDTSTFKKYPLKPTAWQSFKEDFEPTATRIMLEQIRKRRQSSNSG